MSIREGPPKDSVEKRALERVTDAIISVNDNFEYHVSVEQNQNYLSLTLS
jgi:hypothetical protein